MRINFTKMQGLGNDFVVIDAVSRPVHISPQQARRIADRRYGVGCDQILLAERPRSPGVDFFYRIINADGGEVGQCGNGARCLARFVREKGLTIRHEIAVETLAGTMTLKVNPDQSVTVDMGVPRFEPSAVPFVAAAREPMYDLDLDGGCVQIAVLSLGNPHAVQRVTDLDRAPVQAQGPVIERHPRFPERVNAGFFQLLDSGHIRVRVYERGAGETLACGSGACAAMVAGRQMGLLDARVAVELRGGRLRVDWEGEGKPLYMSGPAETVFEGEIELS